MNETGVNEIEAVAQVREWAKDGSAKKIRGAAHLSLKELGARLGVADATVSRWETGARTPSGDEALRYVLTLETLKAVAQAATEPCEACGDELVAGNEHFGSTDSSISEKPWDGAASRFTDEQYKMATAACDKGDGTVKARCFLPHHEPGGATSRAGVHAAAQRISSLKGHDADAVSRAKAHLRSHYAQLKEDVPDSLKASTEGAEPMSDIAEGFAGIHESYTGTHTHSHSSYKSQGGDSAHEHPHEHSGDNLHRHTHEVAASAQDGSDSPWERMLAPFVASGAAVAVEGRRVRLTNFSFRREPGPDQVTGSLDVSDPRWAIRQDNDGYRVLIAGAVPWLKEPVPTYAEAVAVIAEQLATEMAAPDSRPVLDQGWRSEMAFEGVSTGDGRFIEPGAIEFRDCPLPLMLQTETAGGHMGAVLAGAITATGKVGQIALGTGDFDASEAGRQSVQIIEARGRFGVSIDVAEADGEPVCETHGSELEQCDFDCEWELHFSLIRIFGLTLTPFPAFEDAYIELVSEPASGQAEPVAASAEPDDTTLELDERYARSLPIAAFTGNSTGTVVGFPNGGYSPMYGDGVGLHSSNVTIHPSFTAAGNRVAIAHPPKAWFDNPGFGFLLPDGTRTTVGEPRLVRQPNGHYVCPLTVEAPEPSGLRRVYGHLAGFGSCHTGIADRCVTPPKSRTNYAAFNLRPVMTAEGEPVMTGHLTMGVGHAATDRPMSTDEVRAHYDGGPGAVRMAHVRAGEDDYGVWFAGYVDPAVTDEQVEAFSQCSLSGDWREVWRGRGLDLVACLAGVTVPGFPVAALAAAGFNLPAGAINLGEQRAYYDSGQMIALVAAGAVRQPYPWERDVAALEASYGVLAGRLEHAERVVEILRPMATEAVLARVNNTALAAPTKVDASISAALQRVLASIKEVIALQEKDPDQGDDPDDAKVHADLEMLLEAVDKTIADQARDGNDDAEAEPEVTGAK